MPDRPDAIATASSGRGWRMPVLAGTAGVAIAAAMVWLTLGHMLAAAGPGAPLIAGHRSSTILSNRAVELLTQPGDPARLAAGKALAAEALHAEPSNPRAALAAALAADAENRTGARNALLAYSESLSRREFLTQAGLIEIAVAAGDVPGALRHYDRALTTSSKQAPPVLLPILTVAAGEPAVADGLARLLVHRPLWWRQFIEQLSSTGTAPAQMRTVAAALRLDLRDPMERQLLTGVLSRMVEIGGYRDAARLYAGATRGQSATGLTGAAGFADTPGVFPFNWLLLEGADVGGFLEDVGGRLVLGLRANDGASGIAARRLLLMPPGGYMLEVRYGAVTDNPLTRPTVALRCASSQQPFQTFPLPPASAEGGVARWTGIVPASCSAQWVEIGVSGLASQPNPGWIGSVQLTPR